MPRKCPNEAAQLALLEAPVLTAPCVPAIRQKVNAWRTLFAPCATRRTLSGV